VKRLLVVTALLVVAIAGTAAAEPIAFERDLRREIAIDASRRRVWRVLTDFAAYPDWNPFITSIRGPLKVGGQLEVTIQPCGYPEFTFTPVVQSVEARRELSWLGHLGQPGIFDGDHSFQLRKGPADSMRFVQREEFSGTAVLASGPVLDATACGFERMNEALKRRVEAT
jgi:hypothetical protein